MIEKRRWPRVSCQWEAAHQSVTRPKQGMTASMTVDLSEGGVRFRSSAFIPVGDRLRFTIRPPKGQALETMLTSVWVRELPNYSMFEIGGHFEDTSQEGRRLLREWTDSNQAVLVTRVPEAVF